MAVPLSKLVHGTVTMKAILWMTAVLSILLGNICHGENKIEADNDVLIKIVS